MCVEVRVIVNLEARRLEGSSDLNGRRIQKMFVEAAQHKPCLLGKGPNIQDRPAVFKFRTCNLTSTQYNETQPWRFRLLQR